MQMSHPAGMPASRILLPELTITNLTGLSKGCCKGTQAGFRKTMIAESVERMNERCRYLMHLHAHKGHPDSGRGQSGRMMVPYLGVVDDFFLILILRKLSGIMNLEM